MADTFPPAEQRPRLLEIRQAIGAREASLQRDDCVDWAVSGTSGHVYAIPEGFQLYVTTGERPLKWTWIRKKLAFCRLTQDGDDEGCLTLDRLPTMAEGAIIREALQGEKSLISGVSSADGQSTGTAPRGIVEDSRI
jgi:hypothetical protein